MPCPTAASGSPISPSVSLGVPELTRNYKDCFVSDLVSWWFEEEGVQTLGSTPVIEGEVGEVKDLGFDWIVHAVLPMKQDASDSVGRGTRLLGSKHGPGTLDALGIPLSISKQRSSAC